MSIKHLLTIYHLKNLFTLNHFLKRPSFLNPSFFFLTLTLLAFSPHSEALLYKSVFVHPENFDARPDNAKPSLIHIMDTGQTLDEALNSFKEPKENFSVHYLIPEDGKIVYRLVPEEKNALHARNGVWNSLYSLNPHSIGIALVTTSLPPDQRPTQWDHPYPEYTEPQIQALIQLCKQMMSRWDIKPWNVVGNSDIAPGRHFDPGRGFPWERLAQEGIGIWPMLASNQGGALDKKNFILNLNKFGYTVPEFEPGINWDDFCASEGVKRIIAAFQAHYRPKQVDGVIDSETNQLLNSLIDIRQHIEMDAAIDKPSYTDKPSYLDVNNYKMNGPKDNNVEAMDMQDKSKNKSETSPLERDSMLERNVPLDRSVMPEEMQSADEGQNDASEVDLQ